MRYNIVIILLLVTYNILFSQFRAIYIPDNRVTSMNANGDTSDWNWIPRNYVIPVESMIDLVDNADVNKLDMDCSIIVGWSDLTDMVYIMAIVKDDINNIDRVPPNGETWLDDCMEIAVNPDNSGGVYINHDWYRFFNMIKIHYSFPMNDTNYELEINKGPQWLLKNNTNLTWGGSETVNSSTSQIVKVYEVFIRLWDEWDNKGPSHSIKAQLQPYQTIKLSIAFDDVDLISDTRDAKWVTLSGKNWHYDANHLSEFILDKSFDKNITWPNIRYILRTQINP